MIMFGPSLKSVPGCLVSIVPMLIGEPVAVTPGLGPHEEVFVLALLLVFAAAPELELEPPAALLLLELLLPHAASARKASAQTIARLARVPRALW
ncbi:MAG: hypothetical protein JO372_14350 [Solirubrobacterales bacterium]|nr:hypothetical protein [Solirubrobacterales bacterium]